MPFVTGTGQTVSTAVDGSDTGATGRLRIEPDQLDAAIAVFQEALHAVEDEVSRATRDLFAEALGNDDVSVEAANAFNRIGYDIHHAAVKAWEDTVEQFRSIVRNLESIKQEILRVDAENSTTLQAKL